MTSFEPAINRGAPRIQTQQRKALWSLTLLLLVYAAVFWPSLMSMAAIWWRSETYAHGMLIPLISLWLIIRKRSQLTTLEMGSDWTALIPLLGLCLVWLLGRAADVLAVEQMATTLILIALVVVALGRTVARALTFPLAYLIFAVPFGDQLTPYLQQITADFTVQALKLSGVPVYFNGFLIEIPTGRFEVAEACSGLRYLIASVAVGTLYAHLSYRSLRSRLVFIAASALMPVLANGIRAYLIVLIAHLSDMKYATGVDHLIYGWLFFGLVVMLMFWVGSWWRDPEPAFNPAQEASAVSRLMGDRPRALVYATPAAALVILLLTCTWGQLMKFTPQRSALPIQQFSLSPWIQQPAEALDWRPNFVGADRIFQATYRVDRAAAVGLYIADYQSEHQGKELISALNRWYTAKAWTPAGHATRTVPIGASQLKVNVLELRTLDGSMRRIWYWFYAYKRPVTSAMGVKLLQALNKLSGAHEVASGYALAVDYEDSRTADATLTRFIKDNWPELATTSP
jgi:exosortase A